MDTSFGAAIFVLGESSQEVWNDYVRIRENPYIGHSQVIRADYGPQFRSMENAAEHVWDQT